MRADSDFRVQGWQTAPGGALTILSQSITNLSGASLHMAPASGSNAATAPGAAYSAGVTYDYGFYNTQKTVNQAWTAGGFTFGFNGKFNSGSSIPLGGIGGNPYPDFCFDGTYYWAIAQNAVSGAMSVQYSTDLKNWVITTTPAVSGGLSGSATIFSLGGGVVGLIGNSSALTTQDVWYTSNQGTSWSVKALGTFTAAAAGTGYGIATGNSTYPHVVLMSATSTTGGGIYVGSITGTMTQVVSTPADAQPYHQIKIIDGLILIFNITGRAVYSATASSVTLNTGAAWSTATWSATGAPGLILDYTYNPTSNVWVLTCGGAGVYTFPNSGTAGTATKPTGTIVLTNRTMPGTNATWYIVWWTGAQTVAIGAWGQIATSPDGTTWTLQPAQMIPQGQIANNRPTACSFVFSIYDGTKYVLVGASSGGNFLATTTDLVTNYTCMYCSDAAESVLPNNYGVVGVFSGTAPATTGLWTCNSTLLGLSVSAISGGNRTVGAVINSTAAAVVSSTLSATSPINHYYELVATKDPGTINSFFVSLYIDGSLVNTTTTSYPMGSSSSDTTSLLILCLNRSCNFAAYDDMYFLLNDGLGVTGPQGPVNIIARRPETDIQDQWIKTGGTSNSLSVNQAALSSLSTNYVSSAASGNKDIYACSDTIPAGYQIRAVQMEAFFTNTGVSEPEITIGISSGGTESDSPTTTLVGNTPNYIPFIFQTNPNGGVAWTAAAVEAAEFVITHVA